MRFLNLVFNLRQQGRSNVEYTREGDQLNAECPEKFRDVLGHQFIAGLDDRGKVDLVQVYLGAKNQQLATRKENQLSKKRTSGLRNRVPSITLMINLPRPLPL